MVLDPVGAVGVAQLQPDVAIDNHIAFDDAVPRVEPEEDRPPPLTGPALDAHEDVVADHPVLGVHHVDARDVIALGDVRLVVVEPLGPVVVEQAVLDPALLRPDRRAILRRHLDALDPALPDVVNDAVVDRQPLDVRLGVDLEPVPLDVLNGQVRHGHAGARPEAEQFAVRTLGAVDDHALAPARGTPQRHVVGADLDVAVHQVKPVGQQDRLAGLRVSDRPHQSLRVGNLDGRPLSLRQRRRLWKPNRHGRRQNLARLSHRTPRQNHRHNPRTHTHSPKSRRPASYRTTRSRSTRRSEI